jgi:hypothetical protein
MATSLVSLPAGRSTLRQDRHKLDRLLVDLPSKLLDVPELSASCLSLGD